VDDLQLTLKTTFGYNAFRPLQREIIDTALAGRDVFALLPTGGGKSLCFQLPALHRHGLTVVVSPLIALMKDQVDQLQAAGVAATYLNSSVGADEARSRLAAGEIILSIDGRTVDPAMDLSKVLNGPPTRDVRLKVKSVKGEERTVVIRPIGYDAVPRLLYDKWVRDNRRAVETATKGQAGYVHIAGMDEPSLLKFEEELFSAAAGKRGLVIDVRENGGGSTTDHLLTMLTQPRHAIAVARDGKPGYPQDRKIYASWNKPIVVLCNQNSFSNAEIFSHAIKTLKRGKVVGVPTAGGVVSTGSVGIMDIGTLRLPFRGWFLPDTGEDMELHGCVPDVVVWPEPGDLPRGKDVQLHRALEVLLAEVKAFEAKPQPKLRYATEREKK